MQDYNILTQVVFYLRMEYVRDGVHLDLRIFPVEERSFPSRICKLSLSVSHLLLDLCLEFTECPGLCSINSALQYPQR